MQLANPRSGFSLPPQVRARLKVVLCDADGNLFPSEEPAFEASADVMNEFLASLGIRRVFTPDELRRTTTGMTFRRTAVRLAAEHGVQTIDDLESWVDREREVVTAHLAATLRPDPRVREPLQILSRRYRLAVVSSSAELRLWSCVAATGLDTLFGPDRVFSAEDSLPVPTSKPDPAIYSHACAALGVEPAEALAVEDSAPGVRSAVAAGCPTVGNVLFVPPAERAARAAELLRLGALGVVRTWTELTELNGREAR